MCQAPGVTVLATWLASGNQQYPSLRSTLPNPGTRWHARACQYAPGDEHTWSQARWSVFTIMVALSPNALQKMSGVGWAVFCGCSRGLHARFLGVGGATSRGGRSSCMQLPLCELRKGTSTKIEMFWFGLKLLYRLLIVYLRVVILRDPCLQYGYLGQFL